MSLCKGCGFRLPPQTPICLCDICQDRARRHLENKPPSNIISVQEIESKCQGKSKKVGTKPQTPPKMRGIRWKGNKMLIFYEGSWRSLKEITDELEIPRKRVYYKLKKKDKAEYTREDFKLDWGSCGGHPKFYIIDGQEWTVNKVCEHFKMSVSTFHNLKNKATEPYTLQDFKPSKSGMPKVYDVEGEMLTAKQITENGALQKSSVYNTLRRKPGPYKWSDFDKYFGLGGRRHYKADGEYYKYKEGKFVKEKRG